VGSLAIYGNMVSTPPGSKLAVPFLVVPLGSWLLITIVIPMAAILGSPQKMIYQRVAVSV